MDNNFTFAHVLLDARCMRALLSDKVNNIRMIKAISRNAYFSSIGARAQKTEGEMGQNKFVGKQYLHFKMRFKNLNYLVFFFIKKQ